MKLFKSLLVAPAALGLLAPMAATANEVTVKDFNPVIESTLLAGGEGLVDDHSHDGGFSETTTASFSADMAIGAVDGGTATTDDALEAYYGFQIDLNTSFTGEDSLDISIDAGNGGTGLSELDLNDGGNDDALYVDGVAYTFPLAGATVFVGDNMDGSTLYSTACVYGGPSNNLDDCGNGSSALGGGSGTAAGASYEFGDGFAVAVGYTGAGSSTSGLMTKEGTDAFGGQVSYTADLYGVSVTAAAIEDYAEVEGNTGDRNFIALNGYLTPESTGAVPSISVGYEVGTAQGMTDLNAWFVGLQWDEAGPGTFGTAIGTQGATKNIAGDDPELLMYEAFYSYEINDGMTITPLIYTKETKPASDDKTGVMVKTSFSF